MKIKDPNEAERFHVGTTIAGRYLVERPIAEGTMGAVALARHISLDERVAIKFVRPELRRDPSAIARLSREAKALARIKSDHVCRVLDVGVTLSVGPYMVLEYLEGTDLGTLVRTEGPLPAERAVECALQACEALTVAHTAGIVHRDIRPSDLFLARHGQFETLKVLGFGIVDVPAAEGAPRPGEGQPERTRDSGAGATAHPAPERGSDPVADQRSDICSMGMVLHELVTGRALLDAATGAEVCARLASGEAATLVMDDAVLPPSLRSVIARCVEPDPARRYQTVEELAAALAPLATMRERFRGRSTGAFARKLVEEELALSKTQRVRLTTSPVGTRATPAEASLAVRSGLREIGVGVRELARTVAGARIQERPVWMYAAVALASALSIVPFASLTGGVQWVTPPRVSGETENADARGPSRTAVLPLSPAAAVIEATRPGSPAPDDAAMRAPRAVPRVLAAPSPEPSIAGGNAGSPRTLVSGTEPGVDPTQRKHRRPRKERSKPSRAAARASSPAALEAVREPGEHATGTVPRVRLVEEKRVTDRPGSKRPARARPRGPNAKASGASAPGAAKRSAGPAESSSLPGWLETIRRDSKSDRSAP